MPKKCCIYGCQTNYTSEENSDHRDKIPVYRFPKARDERERWKKVVPNANLNVTDNTVVCQLHWPSSFEKVIVRGKQRPKHPLSVWPGVSQSQIPTPLPSPRIAKKSSSTIRYKAEDEISGFLSLDKATFNDLKDELLTNKKTFVCPIVSFQAENVLIVQSVEFCNGVPLFVVRICKNLRFETFHYGIKCYVASLTKNRIHTVDSWSKLEEIIRYLNAMDIDKKDVIQKQISVMSPKPVGTEIYGPEEIVRAFEYFATSRALYNRLRKDFQSPSITTLTRLTFKISKIDENTFLQVFENLESCQKCCIILHDEVYVKKMMLYHGGRLFGKSVDDPSSLAKTVLGIRVLCLNGGPKFLTKMIPVARLHSAFLFEQINFRVTSASADVKAIISDGNRTNQAFLKLYPTIPSKPWLTMNGQYLLFDFVHLLKNIRNLWLTEKTGEYDNNGVQRTAKWEHLRTLHKLESDKLVKLSDLNDISIAPKPVERQRVATCLRVFSEKTYNALWTHPEMNENIEDTAIFFK